MKLLRATLCLSVLFLTTGCILHPVHRSHRTHRSVHVHANACGHVYVSGRWVDEHTVHQHGHACGHVYSGGRWVDKHTVHQHGHACGHVYQGGRWVDKRRHVEVHDHGRDCGCDRCDREYEGREEGGHGHGDEPSHRPPGHAGRDSGSKNGRVIGGVLDKAKKRDSRERDAPPESDGGDEDAPDEVCDDASDDAKGKGKGKGKGKAKGHDKKGKAKGHDKKDKGKDKVWGQDKGDD